MDLLTSAQADEALGSDFDVKDRLLIVHTHTDPQILQEAGFSENGPEVVN
jgi:hypothetical protein